MKGEITTWTTSWPLVKESLDAEFKKNDLSCPKLVSFGFHFEKYRLQPGTVYVKIFLLLMKKSDRDEHFKAKTLGTHVKSHEQSLEFDLATIPSVVTIAVPKAEIAELAIIDENSSFESMLCPVIAFQIVRRNKSIIDDSDVVATTHFSAVFSGIIGGSGS